MNTCALAGAANDGAWQAATAARSTASGRTRARLESVALNADETVDATVFNVFVGASGANAGSKEPRRKTL